MQSDLNFHYCHLTSSVSLEICFQCHLSFYLQERFSCGEVIKKYIGGFFNWCLKKGEKGGKKLQEKAGRGLYVALFLFVGIPLPGTGAWTGTLAASLLDMDFKKSTLAVMCGVVLAGIIMGLVSGGVFSFIR